MAKTSTKMAESRARLGERQRLQSRQAIINAAMTVFQKKTPDAAVIGDFIAAAGVARGTFYNHFRDVDEVCSAVAVQISDEYTQMLFASISHVSDPTERIAFMARAFMRRSMRDPSWAWVIFRVALHGALLSHFRAAMVPDIEAARDAGRILPLDTQLVVDLITGISTTAMRTMLEGDAPATYPEDVTAAILRGLGLKPGEATKLATRPIPPAPK